MEKTFNNVLLNEVIEQLQDMKGNYEENIAALVGQIKTKMATSNERLCKIIEQRKADKEWNYETVIKKLCERFDCVPAEPKDNSADEWTTTENQEPFTTSGRRTLVRHLVKPDDDKLSLYAFNLMVVEKGVSDRSDPKEAGATLITLVEWELQPAMIKEELSRGFSSLLSLWTKLPMVNTDDAEMLEKPRTFGVYLGHGFFDGHLEGHLNYRDKDEAVRYRTMWNKVSIANMIQGPKYNNSRYNTLEFKNWAEFDEWVARRKETVKKLAELAKTVQARLDVCTAEEEAFIKEAKALADKIGLQTKANLALHKKVSAQVDVIIEGSKVPESLLRNEGEVEDDVGEVCDEDAGEIVEGSLDEDEKVADQLAKRSF